MAVPGAAQQSPRHESAAPALSALSDLPVDRHDADGLAFAPYAEALAGLLDHPDTGTPLTLAINAPWGAGKSTLANLIRQRLTAKPAPGDSRPHATCWFNAWMHDDAPSLSTAFAAEVARAANRERHPLRRILSPLPRALWSRAERWFFWLSLLVTFSVLFVLLTLGWEWLSAQWHELRILTSLVTGDALEAAAPDASIESARREALGVGGLSVVLTAVLGRVPKLITAARSVASFLEDPEAAATLGRIADVRAQLGAIIQQARRGPRRFVVFVDDLDRCLPPRAIDLLEVVNQLLDHPGVVVVIMADMPAVAACADIKYKALAELSSPGGAGEGPPRAGTYGRLYVHKIVQLQFDLPPNTQGQLQGLLARLAAPVARANAEADAASLRTRSPWADAGNMLREAARWLPGVEGGRRRQLARMREQLDRHLAAGASASELERLCATLPLPDGQARALLRERALLRLMDDAELLREAHVEVAEHLPPYPRSIKRFLNHVRILTAVTDLRSVRHEWPTLTARHIGRWATIKERWPLTAGAVLRQPARLLELERRARSGASVGELLAAWGAETWEADELTAFLSSGTVSLGEVAHRVLHFVPTAHDGDHSPSVSMRTGVLENAAAATAVPAGMRSA